MMQQQTEPSFEDLMADTPENKALDARQREIDTIAKTQYDERADIKSFRASGVLAVGALTDAETLFSDYATLRERFFSMPFLHNTSVARTGAAFTIVEAHERTVEDMDDEGEEREVYTYIVDLQESYVHEDRKTMQVKTHEPGTYLLQIDKNKIRRSDFNRVKAILQDHGAIRNLTLNEITTDDSTKNNAVSIVHKNQWRHIRDAAARRR